ncbi:unnamed protein product [Closterium sp. NIES-64]|nr:unnamed protein product [Closterium sp. NIES-64]
MGRGALLALATLLMTILAAAPRLSFAMRLTIHSGDRECIWLSTESNHGMLTGSVVVFDHHGSFRDYAARLDVTIKDPRGIEVYTARGRSEAQFDLRVERAGQFELCLKNHGHAPEFVDVVAEFEDAATWKPRSAAVTGTPPGTSGAPNKDELATDGHMEALFDQMYEIKHGLHRMIVDQRFFRSQLHRQRDTIMNTHTRVLQFAAVEAVVLILASALQVLFLRRMFDNSAKRGSGLTGLVNRRKM